MNRKENIEEVIRELERVKISHERIGKLIANLSRKVESLRDSDNTKRERVFTLEESRYLIGRQVRIVNPHKHEKNIGTILSVWKLFVAVDLGEGLRMNRVVKNLRLILS